MGCLNFLFLMLNIYCKSKENLSIFSRNISHIKSNALEGKEKSCTERTHGHRERQAGTSAGT